MSLRRLMAALLFAGFMPLGAGALEVAHLAVRANDLAFCRQDGFLYASVAGSDASYGNRIVRIDPQSAQVIASLPVGSEPGKLAISDDGTVLYVALGGAAAVRQVDLTNLTAGIQFTLGSDTFFGPFYAVAIYAFAKGKDWIRMPTIIWGSVLMTVVFVICFEEMVGAHATPHRAMVLFANAPWFLVPALLITRMVRSEYPFSRPAVAS